MRKESIDNMMHDFPRDNDTRRKNRQGIVAASKKMLVVTRMSGLEETTQVFLNYRFVAFSEDSLTRLKQSLETFSSFSITDNEIFRVWSLQCTSRPQMISLIEDELLDLVYSMFDLAWDHSVGVRGWSVVDPRDEQEYSTYTFY